MATTAFVQAKVTDLGAGDMNKATYDSDDDGKVAKLREQSKIELAKGQWWWD